MLCNSSFPLHISIFIRLAVTHRKIYLYNHVETWVCTSHVRRICRKTLYIFYMMYCISPTCTKIYELYNSIV